MAPDYGQSNRNERKKVLVIAYYFPPLGGSNCLRTLRLIRHLPEFGWDVHVLSVGKGSRGENHDETLMARIPPNIRVTRTKFIDLYGIHRLVAKIPYLRRFLLHPLGIFIANPPPDHCIGWLFFAYLKGKKIINQEGIDVIHTVSGPFTGHLIGYLLKRATGKFWLADFHDEWSTHYFRTTLFSWQARLDRWLEKQVLCAFDHSIHETESEAAVMASLAPPDRRDKFTAIAYGFDAEDAKFFPTSRNEKFTITYSGLFYVRREPTNFLLALESLVQEGKIPCERLRVNFVGPTRRWKWHSLEEGVLQGVIQYTGYLPHSEAICYYEHSDVLLLITDAVEGKNSLPGKAFEYMISGRPILALTPLDGETALLLRQTKTAAGIVEPDDVASIKQTLLDLYLRWERDELRLAPDLAKIGHYEGRKLAKALVEILEAGRRESRECA